MSMWELEVSDSGTMSASEVDRALGLHGKRVRVWYKSERKWKVAKVRSFYVDGLRNGRARVYFKVTCGRKVNSWYYSAEEIHPLERPAPRAQASRRRATASDKELEREVGRAAALLGQRVRVWSKSERKWKVATVRSVSIPPEGDSMGDHRYFQVARAGRTNSHFYRRDELRLPRCASAARKQAPGAAARGRTGTRRRARSGSRTTGSEAASAASGHRVL